MPGSDAGLLLTFCFPLLVHVQGVRAPAAEGTVRRQQRIVANAAAAAPAVEAPGTTSINGAGHKVMIIGETTA
eukprot:366093-Chlamydomonas_euryale.AAC.1